MFRFKQKVIGVKHGAYNGAVGVKYDIFFAGILRVKLWQM